MNVLVINCGSSSLKYQLIDSASESVLAKGLCERIGIDGRFTYKPAKGEKIEKEVDLPDHAVALKLVLSTLTDKKTGVVDGMKGIDAVGHRIVHGGEKFATSVVIDDQVIKDIESVSDLAPLHNPANLIGVRVCKELMPGVPMVAVFDTAFHQTMPKEAYMYGVPYDYYKKYAVRKYGFHGTSHSFVSKRAAEILGKDIDDTNVIVCHLGNGSSVCAVKNGKSVDTSMGLTPLEGMLMGTRSGNIDPAVVSFIADKEKLDADAVMDILNKKSGVAGISGVSSDFRDLDAASREGNERAELALSMFSYQVAKFIGSYLAILGRCDAICFTAGIGENDGPVRARILKYLEGLGIFVDTEKNLAARGVEALISRPESAVKVLVIPTNEELAIARETVALIKKRR
ncbi:MAG: acetate kinase [Lachnospiraceae bacterium]|nr:acetate kinase [Lachnospiraceae bacterium]